MNERGGYVSFGSTQDHLARLITAAAGQTWTTWTVAEEAVAGDLVVFYFTIPISGFLAYGRVIRRSEETWGEDKKPMAEIGVVRLFPEPVTLKRAKKQLGLRWLRAPQGFALRRKENLSLILSLDGVSA